MTAASSAAMRTRNAADVLNAGSSAGITNRARFGHRLLAEPGGAAIS